MYVCMYVLSSMMCFIVHVQYDRTLHHCDIA